MTDLTQDHTSLDKTNPLSHLRVFFRWNKTSYYMLSGFLMLLFLIGYVWWPLVVDYLALFRQDIPLWRQIDWLLIGNFLFMSVMIMANANIKADLPIVVIGLLGGLVIEGWGTQTELWRYYTEERPPLWIIPAWPIASLSIDRLYRLIRLGISKMPERAFTWLHWTMLPAFYILMLKFVAPTMDKSLTIMALMLCAFLIITAKDKRGAVLIFIAGSGLGYFLERWGTTRACWIYYTTQTPPLFAVLAHGMAAVAFWRVLKLYKLFIENKFTSQKFQFNQVE
jgi:hypothetical protein